MEHRDYNPRLLKFARDMRKSPMDAERRMWSILRNRGVGWKFRRQHPVAGYIVDFYCDELRVAVELDGGQHYTPEGQASDATRTERLRQAGIIVLRYSDYDVLSSSDAVMRTIEREMNAIAAGGRPLL